MTKGNPGCSFEGGGLVICRGSNNYYLPRVHREGAKKYELLKRSTSKRVAIMRAAKAMADDRNGFYNRGDVLYCADYYDPMLVLEIRRG